MKNATQLKHIWYEPLTMIEIETETWIHPLVDPKLILFFSMSFLEPTNNESS